MNDKFKFTPATFQHMNVKLKVIHGFGIEFEKEVSDFINTVRVARTSYTHNNILSAFIEYEEKDNGTKPRESSVQKTTNKRDKGNRK